MFRKRIFCGFVDRPVKRPLKTCDARESIAALRRLPSEVISQLLLKLGA